MVRPARREDLPRVIELLQQMSIDAPREDLSTPLREEYERAPDAIQADPGRQVLVLEIEGVILGTAAFMVVPNLSYIGRPHTIIDNVVVDDGQRNKGYGEALVRHCLDLAREAGCSRLSLTTDMRRTDAHRFYERLGFKHSHKGYRYSFY
jgi:GNAT superfamily N-acetyltransferase